MMRLTQAATPPTFRRSAKGRTPSGWPFQRDHTMRLLPGPARSNCNSRFVLSRRPSVASTCSMPLALAGHCSPKSCPSISKATSQRTSPDSATDSRIARKRPAGTLQVAFSGPNRASTWPSKTMDDAWQVDTMVLTVAGQRRFRKSGFGGDGVGDRGHCGKGRVEECRAHAALAVEQEDLRVVLHGVLARVRAGHFVERSGELRGDIMHAGWRAGQANEARGNRLQPLFHRSGAV